MTTAEVILKAAMGALLLVASGCKPAHDDCGECEWRPGAWVNYFAISLDSPGDVLPMAHLSVEQDGTYWLVVGRATEAPIEEPGCGTEGHDPCHGVAQQDLCMRGLLLDDELSTVEQLMAPELLDAYSRDESSENASIELDVEDPEEDLYVSLGFDPDASMSVDTETMLTTFDALVLELFGRGEYCTETDAQIATEGEWLLP